MSIARYILGLLTILATLGASDAAWAQGTSEYQLKSAFLYNFTLYTEWPEEVTPLLKICIYGDNPFADYLEPLQGKSVNDRIFEVTYLSSQDSVVDCQMVFITRGEEVNIPGVIDQIVGKPVLTVSDIPDAINQGIMLGLFEDDGRVAFSANIGSAERSGLKLSSKLLRLAREVRH